MKWRESELMNWDNDTTTKSWDDILKMEWNMGKKMNKKMNPKKFQKCFNNVHINKMIFHLCCSIVNPLKVKMSHLMPNP